MGVTKHVLAEQACLPMLHSSLPRLKNIINEQPGPVPQVGRERRKIAKKDFKVMIELQVTEGLNKNRSRLCISDRLGYKPKNRSWGACGIRLEVLKRQNLRQKKKKSEIQVKP